MKKAPAYAFARRMTAKQTPVRPRPKRQEIALIDLAQKAKKIPRMRALFSGRNGAGKTLAAEFLARHLDVALFRIDLSKVVSKYIGETEKNLARVFDAAELSGAILLFDEADALFGKRSEAKDAHDRYANIEIDYLLQRLEKFRRAGHSVVSTPPRRRFDVHAQNPLPFVIPACAPIGEARPRPVSRGEGACRISPVRPRESG